LTLTKQLSANMNIGDKVRLLRGTEEGVIVKILNESTVEIEIEEGFSFPVLRSEVVVVSKSEGEHFNPKGGNDSTQKPNVKSTQAIAEKGIYLCFEPKGDVFIVWLVNNTDFELVFKADELLKGTIMGFSAGHLAAKSTTNIGAKSSASFESWPDLHFSCLFFQKGVYKSKPQFSRTVAFQASSFTAKSGDIPLVGKKGHVYQLDEMVSKPDAKAIREEMLAPKQSVVTKKNMVPEKRKEVDLHLDQLNAGAALQNTGQALPYQLAVFEKELDNAIAEGTDEVVFIHGVGNGVLREEIHKRLSKMKNILYFQDAQKDRFGYGATLIKIKD